MFFVRIWKMHAVMHETRIYILTTTLAFQLQYFSGCGVFACVFYILW